MKKVLVMLLACIMLFSVVACSKTVENEGVQKQEKTVGTEENTDLSWTAILEKGELVVGNCPEYPPFSSMNTNNEVEGFDSDYARALGEALGVKVVIKDTAWEGLVAGLQKGDHDIIISCMSPEEATAASDNVNMSEPYYYLNEIIVTRTENESIQSKEDLAGKVIGVQGNCTSEVAVDSLKDMGIEAKEIKRYNRNSEALIDLKNERVEAVVVGFAYAATQIKGDSDFKIVNDPVLSAEIVAVLNKGSDELTNKINEAINTLKGNGGYDAVYKKWLDL